MEKFFKIKNIIFIALFLVMGFCFSFVEKTEAAAILRYGTKSVSCVGNSCILTFQWTSDVSANRGISYTIGESTTNTWIQNEMATTHEMSFVVDDEGTGKEASVSLKIYDVGGNLSAQTSAFTINTRAPYLEEITSTNFTDFDCDLENDNDCFYETIGDDLVCTYGPGRALNIKAIYDKAISGSMTVRLNNDNGNANSSISLSSISDDNISGTYTIGATGSGQNTTNSGLNVYSVSAQNICSEEFCVTNKILPSPGKNLKEMGDAVNKIILIDTTAPIFSSVNPTANSFINQAAINAEEGSNSIKYYIAERLKSGTIIFKEGETTRVTCTLQGTALSPTGTKTIDFGADGSCLEGDVTASFVDGTTYSMQISGTDLVGNTSSTTTVTGIIYDESNPTLESFNSDTEDGTYDSNDSPINIKAIFAEPLLGNRNPILSVTLNNGKTVTLNSYITVDGKGELSGSYLIGARGSGESKGDLTIESISSSSDICDRAENCSTISTSDIPSGENLADNRDIGVDTMGYNIGYFSDEGLNTSLGANPRLKSGTYYLKITSLESLKDGEVPAVTIDAEGTANDISAVNSVSVSGNTYRLTRTISSDALAVGSVREGITITGKNLYDNVKTVTPENTSYAAYTDTTLPTISSFNFNEISDEYLFIGENNITITFSEAIDSESVFTLKLDSPPATCINGAFGEGNLTWSCQLTIGSGGDTVLYFDEGSENPNDLAGNELAGGAFYTKDVTIEGTPPTITVNEGVGEEPNRSARIKTDTINVSVTDSGSGVNGQWYGFVASAGACEEGASISNSFTSGSDFYITGDHTDYLCIKAKDNAGNEAFQSLGQLNVDNTNPSILAIKAVELDELGNEITPVPMTYIEGETIHLKMEFTETINAVGNSLVVDFNSGFSCNFTIGENATESNICNIVIESGYSTEELEGGLLKATQVTGTAYDLTGVNALDKSLDDDNNFPNQDITIDAEAPILESFSADPVSGTYGPETAISITANYSEEIVEGSTLSIELSNGVEVVLNSISGSDLSGTYTIGATNSGQDASNLQVISINSQSVEDSEGNIQTGTSLPETNLALGLNVDTSAPQFNSVSPASDGNIGNITDDSDISFYLSEALLSGKIEFVPSREGQVYDEGGTKTCTLVDLSAGARNKFNTATGCSGEITLVSGARYDIIFSGSDNYGNSGSLTRTNIGFDINLDAPEISDCQITYVNSSTVTIGWTTDELADTAIDYGISNSYGKTIEDDLSELGTSHSITLYDLNAGTEYYFRMRSSNDLNNESYSNQCEDYGIDGDARFIAPSPDPPTISNVVVPAEDITSNSAHITWETNEAADSYIEYGTDTSYGSIYGSPSLFSTHSIYLPANLEPETTYHFRVLSRDNTGDQAVSEDYTFTTIDDGSGDGDGEGGIQISSVNASAGDVPNSIIITWNTNVIANGSVRYGLDEEYGQTASEDLTIDNKESFAKEHTITLYNLLSNSSYNFKVVSYDQSGNIATSANDTFSTDILQLVSEPRVTNAGTKGVVIIWETVDPSFTELEYGTSTSYGKTYSSEVLSNLHRVELSDLTSGQVYHFKIKGESSSDTIYSRDYLFGTFTKPVVSGVAVSEITDSSAVVDWKVSVPSESYVEYQNASDPEDKGSKGLPGLQTESKVILSGLKQGSEYTFKIKGIDVNKNDFESVANKFNTPMDIIPPEITQVSTDSSLMTGKEDKVQTIISWKTDEPATSQVLFDIGGNKEGELTQKSKEDSNLTTNHLVVLTNLRSGTIYRFKVVSKDKNANQKESQDFTLLTPQKSRSVIQMIIANFEQAFGWMKKVKN